MVINRQELNLRAHLSVFKKRRQVIYAVLIFGLFLAFFINFTSIPKYESSTKIMIEKVEPGNLTGGTTYPGRDPEFFETQYQLIKSRAVVARVVEALTASGNIDVVSSYFGERAKKLSIFRMVKNFFKNEENEKSNEAVLIENISEEINVRPLKNSRLVSIGYTVPNPEVAALLANATVRAYVEEVFRMKLDSARRTLEWMTKKAQEEGKKLEKAEKALQAYMKEHNLMALEDRRIGVPEQLSRLSTDVIIAQTRRKELETLYYKVRKVADDPQNAVTIPAVAGDRALQELRGQILMTEKSIMELSAKYGDKHPVMIKAYGDLRVLRNKERQEIRRIVQTIKNDYELALANEHNLESQIQMTNSEAHLLNEKFIQYGVLKRDVDTSRQMFDSLMLKLKEQSITQENQAVDVWIVEEAIPSKDPISPRKAMNLFLGLILGLSGGIGFAFLAEYLDNTIKDPADVERAFDIPVLGVIELWKAKGVNLENILIEKPDSRLSESYRGLRTAIQLSFSESPPKKILLTSSAMGEGKTTTAANLALSLAQSNSRVLLIEGDLRKPRIHKIFKISNNNGLSNYLAGAGDGHIIQKGPVPNMAIIPSGPIPPNPSELLGSNRMKVLLESVSKEFDYVVCDTPPLLPVADARILGRLFDGVILVSKAGKTTYDLVERSMKMLNDIGAKFLGMVINAHDVKTSGYYHQSYYDYYESQETQPESPKG